MAANLNINEMRDYQCWLKYTPAEILFQAKAFGGWDKIFPGRVPPWASKVRNYFNVLPTTLARLPKEYAEAQMANKNGPRQTFLANCHGERERAEAVVCHALAKRSRLVVQQRHPRPHVPGERLHALLVPDCAVGGVARVGIEGRGCRRPQPRLPAKNPSA